MKEKVKEKTFKWYQQITAIQTKAYNHKHIYRHCSILLSGSGADILFTSECIVICKNEKWEVFLNEKSAKHRKLAKRGEIGSKTRQIKTVFRSLLPCAQFIWQIELSKRKPALCSWYFSFVLFLSPYPLRMYIDTSYDFYVYCHYQNIVKIFSAVILPLDLWLLILFLYTFEHFFDMCVCDVRVCNSLFVFF